MNLFTLKNSFPVQYSNVLEFLTPLGFLKFDCLWMKNSIFSLPPDKIEQDEYQTVVSHWYLDHGMIAFARFMIKPALPSGMMVDQCLGGIWRVKAFKEVSCDFSCFLDTMHKPIPESGEKLLTQSFENSKMILSIGTEDEESCIERAKSNNWFPHRFQYEMNANQIEYTPQGFCFHLPSALKQDEELQVHFICAWASDKQLDLSTWFAVDQSPNKILKDVNIS